MTRYLYIFFTALLFIFLIVRAIAVPLVHDEIATFFYYIQQIDWNPLAGANPDANNHILNSILAGISHKYLGYSAFSIRLPNLLSFIPYAYFVYKIGLKLTKNYAKYAFYIGMLFPLYFIQFFALSRGYGMSMAFLIGAFYYTFTLYNKNSLKQITFGVIYLILAVYANMSLLPLVLFLALVKVVLVWIKRENYTSTKAIIILILNTIFFGFLMFYAIIISFKMKNEGALYYGELDGFWKITIQSELMMLFENSSLLYNYILIFVLVLVGIVYFFNLKKDKLNSIILPQYLFFYSLIAIVIGIELMAKVLEINYPEDRVGIYLYPLLLGVLCFGVDSSKLKISPYFLLPILIVPLHFIGNYNFDYTSQWKSGYINNDFYETIKKHDTNSKYPATVAGDAQRIFIYTNKIYMDSDKKANSIQLWEKTIFDTNLNVKLPNHPGKNLNYLISKPKYLNTILPLYDSIGITKLTHFRLYKRKQNSEKELITKTNKITSGETSNEFFEFFHQKFDSLNYDAIFLGLDIEIQSLSHPFRSRIVVEIRGTNESKPLEYHYFHINWMYPKTEAKLPIIKSFVLNNLKHYTKNGKIEIVAYLWNIDKKPYSIYKGETEVFKIKN